MEDKWQICASRAGHDPHDEHINAERTMKRKSVMGDSIAINSPA